MGKQKKQTSSATKQESAKVKKEYTIADTATGVVIASVRHIELTDK